MNMLSFLGETPTIALRLAQDECGEEAIVISTKKISDARANGKNLYEVVVAIEDEDKKKNLIYTKSAISKASENSAQMKTHVYDFKEEILKMQGVLEQVQKSIWNPKSQLYDLTIPPEFASMYNTFELNEFDQEMTYTIMKKTIKQLPIALKSNPKKVNDFFKLILRRVIPIKHEVPLRKHQRKIIMMVGPTGVGKTTTISKLAARYAYKLGQRNIGGGVIGILVAFPFIKLLGTLGTVILALGLAIVFIVFIFGFKPSEFISEFLYDMEERKNEKKELILKEKEERNVNNRGNKIYNVEEDNSVPTPIKETRRERKQS